MDTEHLDRLRSRAEQARLDFMLAKSRAEIFDENFGPLTYIGPWEKESRILWQQVKVTYVSYRNAWIDFQAYKHEVPRTRRETKSTEAFGAPVPNHIVLTEFERRVRASLNEET